MSAPTTKRCYVLKWGRSGGVYATANGGAKWVRRTLPKYADRYRFYLDIDFPAARVGWAVGDSGRIVRTGNAGANWKKQASGCTARLTAVDFVDTKVGYVVGKGGRVLKTSDGGRRWVRLTTGTKKGLNGGVLRRPHAWLGGRQRRGAPAYLERRQDLARPALRRRVGQVFAFDPGRLAYMRWTKGTKPRRS